MGLNKEDFTYTSDVNSYMIYYRGKPIGGAGVLLPRAKPLHWEHTRANITFFRDQAELSISNILSGNMSHYAQKTIEEVNSVA
jgi:hypothetical protein